MYKYVIFLIIAWSTHHAAMSLEIYSDNNNHPAFISTACNGAIAIYHNKNQGGFYEKALHIDSQYIDIKQHLLQETPGNCQLLAITYPSSTTNNNFAFIIRINENNCLHTVLFHDRSYQRVLVHLNDVLQKAVTDKSCIIPFLAWSHANQTLLHSCFKKSEETKNSIVTIDQERKTISYVDTNFLTTTLRFFFISKSFYIVCSIK